jgi:DNA modification methylase
MAGAWPVQITQRELATITPYARNPRQNDNAVEGVARSIKEFGFQQPIVVDSAGVIVIGHTRYKAAQWLGLVSVPVHVADDLSVEQITALRIADNSTGEAATWDMDLLPIELASLRDADYDIAETGLDPDLMAGLLDPNPKPTTVTEEPIPEPPVEPNTKPGDLWQLGEHRLLCGDSTNAEHVKRLMAGESINIAFTSPPYASQRKYDESSGFKPIPPDQFVEWFKPIAANVKSHLAADGSWFVNIKEHCEDGQRSLYVKDLTLAHARQWGWRFVDEFVWKRGGVPGKWGNRFKNQWEPVFHFCVNPQIKLRHENVMHRSEGAFEYSPDNPKSKTGFFSNKGRDDIAKEGMALPGNVLQIGTEVGQTENHSAPFPVALPTFFIKAFTDESDTVYEPFCGSGSTLIAAEQLSRKCYGMEISPQYCDVIVKRWENLTGRTAELIEQ